MHPQASVSNSFRIYERKIDKIYFQLHSMKESYNLNDFEILLEGFFDTLKNAAKGVGKFLGKTTQKVSNFSSEVWDKGVEMGKKVLDVTKELVNKISQTTQNVINAIKTAPGRLMDACSEFYASISNEVSEMYKKAKEKGGEWIKNFQNTMMEIYNKIAFNLSRGVMTFVNWAKTKKEDFKKMVSQKKSDILKAASTAKESGNQTIRNFALKVKSIFDKGKDLAKNVAIISLALVILPFYASAKLAQKTYKMGPEILNAVSNSLNVFKKNCKDVWNEAVASFKEGREEVNREKENKASNKPSEESKPEEETEEKKESYIHKTFENFVSNKF